MANANFTCVLDAWRDGTTLYGRMHYYRTDGQTFSYADSSFPNPTMDLGGVTFTDTAFGNWVRGGISVGNVYTTTFSRTVGGTGSRTVTFTAGSGQRSDFAGTWSATVGGFPGVTTPPEDLTISAPYGITSTGASFDVSVSSYGTPASASGRYIEAAILETSDYNGNKRAAIASNVNSDSIHVDNNSTQVTSLTIKPNTEYYYGAYATNTQTSTMTVSGQFVTPPADPTVSLASVDGFTATLNYSVNADGGHYNRILEYSLDWSTWNSAVTISDGNAHTGTFTITNLQAHTSYNVWVRVKTDAGTSPYGFVSFTTKSMFYGAAKHFGNLQLKGDTTQQTYSGKNRIYPQDIAETTISGLTFSVKDSVVTINGTASAIVGITSALYNLTGMGNTKPAISVIPISGSWTRGNIGFRLYDSGNIQIFHQQVSNNGAYFNSNTLTDTNIAQADHAEIFAGSQCIFSNFKFYVMLTNSATIETQYEPYVGGIPAPNPDYPQEVQTVTGRQVITITDGGSQSQSFEVNLGKNLWNPTPFKTGYVIAANGTDYAMANGAEWEYKEVLPSTTYTISLIGGANDGSVRIHAFDKSGNWLQQIDYFGVTAGSSATKTFTTPANIGILRWSFFNNSTNNQLERGSTATSYAPYFTPIELCKIGTYQDYIYKSGDDWYVRKAVRHLQLAINDMNNTDSNPGWAGQTQFKTDLGTTSGGQVYTDTSMITNIAGVVSSSSASVTKNFNGSNALLLLPTAYYGNSYTQTYWKANYGSLVVDFYYGINNTPTDTQITNQDLVDQLDALYSAQTYGDDTVVTVTSADLGAGFSADYITTKRVEKLYGGVNAIGDLHIAGDTTQQTYSGKNLIGNLTSTGTNNGLTTVVNADGSLSVSGTATSTYATLTAAATIDVANGTAMTFSVESNPSVTVGVILYNTGYANRQDMNIGTSARSVTVTTNSAKTLAVVWCSGLTTNTFYDFKIEELQLEKSSSVTDYEPYVGGTPAPNPDYPQEVQTVTGRQVITITDGGSQSQSFEVNLGKNLFDGTYVAYAIGGNSGTQFFSAANSRTAVIECKPNTTYTISKNTPSNRFNICDYSSYPTGATELNGLANQGGQVLSSLTVTTHSDAKYMFICVSNDSTEPELQVELGSTATTYAPYFTPIELCKIGTYQDYIYKSGDDWYVHKACRKHIIDTSEISLYSDNYTNLRYVVIPKPADSIFYNSYFANASLFCESAIYSNAAGDWDNSNKIGGVFSGASAANFWFGFPKSVTLADAQAKLASSALYYPLTTPTDIQITEQSLIDQLDALHSATTYRDDTVVITASPDVPAQVTAIWISSREILKLYGSVNGQSKLVYKALS